MIDQGTLIGRFKGDKYHDNINYTICLVNYENNTCITIIIHNFIHKKVKLIKIVTSLKKYLKGIFKNVFFGLFQK